ncbi:MAG: hypothetical protein ACOYOK_10850 [Pseudobdellovibrionaceae bacterium]|jgi:hypothetical protein
MKIKQLSIMNEMIVIMICFFSGLAYGQDFNQKSKIDLVRPVSETCPSTVPPSDPKGLELRLLSTDQQARLDAVHIALFDEYGPRLCNLIPFNYEQKKFESENSIENIVSILGVAKKTATTIFTKCHQFAPNAPTEKVSFEIQTKNYPRHFFVVKANGDKNPNTLTWESWTTAQNFTFISNKEVFEKKNEKKLKYILLHELAISLDAKYGMNFIKYLFIEQFYNITVDDKGWTTIHLGQGDRCVNFKCLDLKDADKAFEWASSSRDVSNALSSMRADNAYLEFIAKSEKKDNRSYLDPKQCIQTLQKFLPYSLSPDSEKFLNAKTLMLNTEDNSMIEVSFCQYMAFPIFSQQSNFNECANGPAPRTTGGI